MSNTLNEFEEICKEMIEEGQYISAITISHIHKQKEEITRKDLIKAVLIGTIYGSYSMLKQEELKPEEIIELLDQSNSAAKVFADNFLATGHLQ